MKHYALILICILSLISCASKAAIEPESVVDNIPEDWAIETPITINISDIWWNEFQDEKLNQFLSQFLDENINLEQAMLNTRIAKQASVISTSTLFPSIGIGASAGESEQNSAGFPPILSALFGEQSDEITTFTQENYNLSLNTQWEIDLWGKMRQGRLAGKQQYLAAQYNYTYYQFSLTSEATKLYFSIIEAKQLTNNTQQKYNNAKIIFDLYTSRYNKGIISLKALQQSELMLNLAKSDLENKKSISTSLVREAKVLIREYPNLILDTSTEFPKSIPNIPEVIPASIIKRRPDLIASQYNLLASKALNKQAMRSLYPSFSLVGSTGTSSNVQDLLNDDFSVWSAGLNLLSPIFNGGKLIANKKIAKTNQEIAMLEFVDNLLGAYKEVESGLEFDRSTQLSLNLLKDNIILSESIYKTTFDEFSKGVARIEDVINANNALFDNKNMLATTERIRIEQRINLILALGGGFTYKR
ncbi:MAG: TolC family protein [Candidatus Marinimicrobia bacterium]|nr:TolC family protein [Candidatus Neomarinimicrobiota bacterium]